MQAEEADYDVAIVGGGMVGATLACALDAAGGDRPVRVVMIEAAAVKQDAAPVQPSFDARSTALSWGSAQSLDALRLWPALRPAATPIRRIHVSDRGRFGAVRMDSGAEGVEALGYVVENADMGRAFNRRLRESARLDVIDRSSVAALRAGRGAMELETSGGSGARRLRARLVVLAEGGRSGLCEKLGIHRHEEKYRQSAVIANVCFEKDHSNTAWERFTADGPLALLPLSPFRGCPRAALVWTRPAAALEDVMALDEEDFLRALQEVFGYRLGRFLRAGERFSYPLSLVRAEEQYRPGLVLLGNAANSLHPVAGQGFNLALRNALLLAESIGTALHAGGSPGELRCLESYAARAAADQDRTVAFSDYLTRLFSSDRSALVWARKFGLFSIDLLPALKSGLARQAMGLGGRMARLPGSTEY